MANVSELQQISKLVRYWILKMTTEAGSGHPTSALSATDLAVALFFGGKFRYDIKNPQNPTNDRIIFSKGHASPLLYALWAAAGAVGEKELMSYRKFGSTLEGHPTPRFKFAEVATGSLGQGLSMGVGMAIAARLDRQSLRFSTTSAGLKLPYITYVLLGDSESAEGSVWEAFELAAYHKLDNLVAILDVNRLGQSTETMLGWRTDIYRARGEAFGWDVVEVDGHDVEQIINVYERIAPGGGKPKLIVAKTVKGKGVPFLEDKEGWHGKSLSAEDLEKALFVLGEINKSARGKIAKPELRIKKSELRIKNDTFGKRIDYKLGEEIATRKAYGNALVRIFPQFANIVVMDGETSNSTFSEIFKQVYPQKYFEMFIAEQNMVGTAVGLSARGKIPFISTFTCFFARAFDQIRMSAISDSNIKFVGSHAGVSIGEDGPSQMGLEDFAMFRAVQGSVVLCPADAVACESLVELAAKTKGNIYIRTQRPATPVLYEAKEVFNIGGSKIIRSNKSDKLTIVACGITLVESIKAADVLKKEGINVRVVDAYSIKPIDQKTLISSAHETGGLVITVEDHYFEGGLGDAVLNVFSDDPKVKVYKMAVSKMPKSGKPQELLDYEEISSKFIVSKVKELLR